MEKTNSELLEEVERKIHFGEELIKKLAEIQHIDGVPKLQRKIKQEIIFLKKLRSSQHVKKEQLSCSNLRHLEAVVDCSLRPGVISVSKVMQTHQGSKVSIDVISENGKVWTKVIARNPRSLSALSGGNASYGARSVLDQAQDYLDCAKQHPSFYQTPQVIFEFVSGIEDVLAAKLQDLGIVIKGSLVPTYTDFLDESDSECSSSDDEDFQNIASCIQSGLEKTSFETPYSDDISSDQKELIELNTLNLDVTTMMAFVSNLTNGTHNFVFQQPLLSQQAIWEAKRPVKPILDELFKDKCLVCCEAAWDDFKKIVDVLGGPQEKRRAADLKARLTVMPDDENGPDEPKRADLRVRGRIRLRSKMVFNFGQRIRALTISANEGFVRAARQQGVTYAAIIHESRALTEQKEATANVCILPTS